MPAPSGVVSRARPSVRFFLRTGGSRLGRVERGVGYLTVRSSGHWARRDSRGYPGAGEVATNGAPDWLFEGRISSASRSPSAKIPAAHQKAVV
jgi:hypothetical protein